MNRTSPPIMLDSIHHITLCVADIDEAINWYTTSFRCEVSHRSLTEAILHFENTKIHLSLPSQQRSHIAFTCERAGEFGQLRPRIDGTESSYIADSTGNPVELVKTNTPNV